MPSRASSPNSPGAGSGTASSIPPASSRPPSTASSVNTNADHPRPFVRKADPDEIIAARNERDPLLWITPPRSRHRVDPGGNARRGNRGARQILSGPALDAAGRYCPAVPPRRELDSTALAKGGRTDAPRLAIGGDSTVDDAGARPATMAAEKRDVLRRLRRSAVLDTIPGRLAKHRRPGSFPAAGLTRRRRPQTG